MTVADFDAAAQTGFKNMIINALPPVCGAKGEDKCSIDDLKLTVTSAGTNGIMVGYAVETTTQDKAANGAGALNALMADASEFISDLQESIRKANPPEVTGKVEFPNFQTTQFDTFAQNGFKDQISGLLPAICGDNSDQDCKRNDVVVKAENSGANLLVTFVVKTTTAAKATAGAEALVEPLSTAQVPTFIAQLKAKISAATIYDVSGEIAFAKMSKADFDSAAQAGFQDVILDALATESVFQCKNASSPPFKAVTCTRDNVTTTPTQEGTTLSPSLKVEFSVEATSKTGADAGVTALEPLLNNGALFTDQLKNKTTQNAPTKITAELTFTGISAADLSSPVAKDGLKDTISSKVGSICGPTGTEKCSRTDISVSVTSARRSGAKVDYSIATIKANANSGTSAATSMTSNASSFLGDLQTSMEAVATETNATVPTALESINANDFSADSPTSTSEVSKFESLDASDMSVAAAPQAPQASAFETKTVTMDVAEVPQSQGGSAFGDKVNAEAMTVVSYPETSAQTGAGGGGGDHEHVEHGKTVDPDDAYDQDSSDDESRTSVCDDPNAKGEDCHPEFASAMAGLLLGIVSIAIILVFFNYKRVNDNEQEKKAADISMHVF